MKCILILMSLFVLLVCATAQTADKSVCQLPKVTGPCRKAEFVFYHNSEAKECQPFTYGGCQGNGNRFETKELCEKACL